jgi:hypothetical protein
MGVGPSYDTAVPKVHVDGAIVGAGGHEEEASLAMIDIVERESRHRRWRDDAELVPQLQGSRMSSGTWLRYAWCSRACKCPHERSPVSG